ncbi:MAG: hypothetical protein Kow00117_07240 [Phototrophicales bacterium]|nr:MAG: hypothetical protein D6711_08395 [Chloroflexota bacterium]
MGQDPISRKALTRAAVAGVILAGIGIVLFIGIWILLDDIDALPRLFVALCIPPGVIAIILGVFFLIVRPKPPQSSQ